MGWYDDLSVRAKQADSKAQDIVGKDIYAFLRQQFQAQTVKVGLAATGNLTEEQLKKGLRGNTVGLAQPQSSLADNQNVFSASQLSVSMGNYMPYILLTMAGLVAYKLLIKKGRR